MKTIYLVQFLNALILSLLFIGLSDAADCTVRPVYSHIVKLKPNIDREFADKLAVLIRKYSAEYELNPHISVAIAMQETGLENKHRKQKVYVLENGYYKIVEGVTDVSLFQFHINTIQHYNLDPHKLSENLEYAVKNHFKIMADKVKMCSDLGKDAWVCYHSKTKVNREHYKKLVSRYLASGKCDVEDKKAKSTSDGRMGLASI
jgi:hypothetical protein